MIVGKNKEDSKSDWKKKDSERLDRDIVEDTRRAKELKSLWKRLATPKEVRKDGGT